MTVIRFGTDGWRGRIADDYTFANVRRCAQGFARWLLDTGQAEGGVVIGYDHRFASEHFAEACAEVLAGNGIRVYLCDRAVPTPVISYSVVARGAAGAINITASHNPPTDNGFKVRNRFGGAVDPQGLREIEARIPPDEQGVKRMPLAEARAKGLVEIFDPAPAYIAHLQQLVDLETLRQADLTVVVDPMWGNGIGWLRRLLSPGRIRVVEIHGERNPIFPRMKRPEPIPPNLDDLQEKVRELKADAGIATDGDADRVGLVDERGEFVDQLRVYGLLALYLLEVRGQHGPIVKTLSTTSMLEKLGERYGVPVYETGVGFKYVAPKMLETDALIGGEESGGFAFRGHLPERDGILAGLYLLDFMVRTGKRPSELIRWLFELVGPHYYSRIDVEFPPERREETRARLDQTQPDRLAGLQVVRIDRSDGYKFYLEDGGWLLIRFSGTEPLLRIYTETTVPERVAQLLEEGRRLAGLEG
jgi:phosphomannomutase